jgi:uncharacterized protein (TIGR04255 family)
MSSYTQAGAMRQPLKNAPIYFSIAQVRHNPVLSIRDYLPKIQESMRKAGYPDFAPALLVAFNFGAPGSGDSANAKSPALPTPQQVERYIFSSSNKSMGFIVEQNAFSFQSTEYGSYETFSEEFFRGLEVIHKIVGLDYSERIGLRYLDAVSAPGGEEELWSFLIPEILGLVRTMPKSMGTVAHSFSETVIITPAGNVTARAIIRNAQLGFPADLQPLGLKIAERFEGVNGLHAILDTDAAWQTREEFDMPMLRRRLDDLHIYAQRVFDSVVTAKAMTAWN